MWILAGVLALVMGLVLGLLGGGGSILTVPILVYVLAVPPKEAIALSLLVVGSTSAIALVSHARAGNIVWRVGLVFGAFGMLGAWLGGRLAAFVPGALLLVGFGALLLVTAVAMLRRRGDSGEVTPPPDPALTEAPETTRPLPVVKLALEGLVVGAVTGLVGAGGGFLIVPALALLGGLSMKHAIGTSLLVIAMKSFAGFAGFAGHVAVDYRLGALFVAAAAAGTLLGAALVKRWRGDGLSTAFAVFVLVMGQVILAEQLAAWLPWWTWLVADAVAGLAFLAWWLNRRESPLESVLPLSSTTETHAR